MPVNAVKCSSKPHEPPHGAAGHVKTAIRTLLVSAMLVVAGAAAASPFEYTWPLRDLATSDSETVELRDDRGQLLKRIKVDQLLYIYSVAQAMQEVSELKAVILIVDGTAPNAFATKGRAQMVVRDQASEPQKAKERTTSVRGRPVRDEDPADEADTVEINIIGINFGMLDLLGMDMHMAAALIGHELGHLKLHHGEEAEKHGRIDMRNAAATRYSRDNERDADYLGAIWAVEAGFDPAGAARLQETLYESTKFRSGVFVGSHPSSTERIAILKSLARRLSK